MTTDLSNVREGGFAGVFNGMWKLPVDNANIRPLTVV